MRRVRALLLRALLARVSTMRRDSAQMTYADLLAAVFWILCLALILALGAAVG